MFISQDIIKFFRFLKDNDIYQRYISNTGNPIIGYACKYYNNNLLCCLSLIDKVDFLHTFVWPTGEFLFWREIDKKWKSTIVPPTLRDILDIDFYD